MHQVILNVRAYTKQKINLAWPYGKYHINIFINHET